VVAFFVPQGTVGDSTVMNQLSECLYQITVQHSMFASHPPLPLPSPSPPSLTSQTLERKSIVIISHADEIPGQEERNQVMEDVCQALSIDNSSIIK
jgi:hypothetical protein